MVWVLFRIDFCVGGAQKKVIKYIPKDSIVCDIGCGQNPYFLKKISNLVKYGIGFDKELKNFRDSKFELKKLEIHKNIPLGNESCDVVMMLVVLEHLLFPSEILKESFRILKKSGKLILTTPRPIAKPILEFFAFRLPLVNREEIADHQNYFKAEDIKKLLREAGFNEKDIKIYFFEFFLNTLIIASK